jgi:hypothetical protein
MGRRSRKARPAAGERERAAASDPTSLQRGYARSRARDEALRARLTPLAPGERPPALIVAAAAAAALGIANVAFLIAGVEVRGEKVSAAGVLGLSALLLIAAAGMWLRRYWAVLGFQVVLGITIAFAALSLLVASNVAAVVLCLAIVALGGRLFWKLVRVMGRLQAPSRGPRHSVR